MLQKSENRQVTRITILISPIDYCVRINGEPDHLFIGDIQSQISCLLTLLHEHHYITQPSKLKKKLNRSSTMLNNVCNSHYINILKTQNSHSRWSTQIYSSLIYRRIFIYFFPFFFISFISTITRNKSYKFFFCLQNWYKTYWDQQLTILQYYIWNIQ